MDSPLERTLGELIAEKFKEAPDHHLHRLLIETYKRYEYHSAIAVKNHLFYRNSHYFLSFFIPTYSGLLTYLASTEIVASRPLLGAFGFLLTAATIAASTLKPYERCIAAGNISISLNDWKTDLIIDLSNMNTTPSTTNTTNIYEFIKQKDRELSTIGQAMMEGLIVKSHTISEGHFQSKSQAIPQHDTRASTATP